MSSPPKPSSLLVDIFLLICGMFCVLIFVAGGLLNAGVSPRASYIATIVAEVFFLGGVLAYVAKKKRKPAPPAAVPVAPPASPRTNPPADPATPLVEPEVVEEVTLQGFDPEGEPTVRVMSDGSLVVVFEFMPPSFCEDDEEKGATFDDFDAQLSRALGVPVFWEDREFFSIAKPRPDTIERLRAFVAGYRKGPR